MTFYVLVQITFPWSTENIPFNQQQSQSTILDKIKWKTSTPPSKINDESARKLKTTIFFIIGREGWSSFSIWRSSQKLYPLEPF